MGLTESFSKRIGYDIAKMNLAACLFVVNFTPISAWLVILKLFDVNFHR